jgi:ribosome biogenesis protein ENP2
MASVLNVNGVSIYWLTSGKVYPSWLRSVKRKAAEKKEEKNSGEAGGFSNKLTLIQDFEFPSACYNVTPTPDGRYIVATGGYPPRVRVFDVEELSLKCERYMDSAPLPSPLSTAILSDDYRKIAVLQDDRHVEFHAGYGKHYRTRLPVYGRCMVHHASKATLYFGGTSPLLYSLDLAEGRWQKPMVWANEGNSINLDDAMDERAYVGMADVGCNALAIGRLTGLLASGGEGGVVTCWDPRDNTPASKVATGSHMSPCDVTALAFDEASLSMVAGTSNGRVLLFDLRKASPLLTKSHQYETSIKKVLFHRSEANVVMSADSKIVKFWNKHDVRTPYSYLSDRW